MRRVVATTLVVAMAAVAVPAPAQTAGIPGTIAWVENGDTLYVGSGDLSDWVRIGSGGFIQDVEFVNGGLDVVYNSFDFVRDPHFEIRLASAAGDQRPRVLTDDGGYFGIDPSDRGSDQVVYSSLRDFEITTQDRLFSVALDASNPPTAIGPAPDEGFGYSLVGVSAEYGPVFSQIPSSGDVGPGAEPAVLSLLAKQDGLVRNLGDGIGGISVSPDGRHVVYSRLTGPETYVIGLLSLADSSRVELATEFTGPATVAVSPDGSTVVAIVGGDFGEPTGQSAATVFDAEGRMLGGFQLPDGHVETAAFSPDGRLFTAGGFTFRASGFVATFPVDYSAGYAAMGEATVVETVGVVTHVTHSPRPVPDLPVRSVQPGMVNPLTGEWHLWDESGDPFSFYYGVPADVPMVGDWDCDGIDTPGLYRQSDGFAYLRNSSFTGSADLEFVLGNPGDIPLAGDFDGDGCDTVSVYRPAEGRVFVSNRLGADGGAFEADYSYYFGDPGDKPFVGDFDGNGIDTIGLHRESTGLVYFTDTSQPDGAVAPTSNEFFYGIGGDRLFTGDWNSDGTDSVAVFRPDEALVYLNYQNTQAVADEMQPLGFPDWLPIAGRFADTAPSVLSQLPRFDVALMPPDEVAELDVVAFPVLLPVPPDEFAGKVTFAQSTTYTVVLELEGADVVVFGDAFEPRPGQRPWEPEYHDVHGIKEVMFVTNEGAYNINVECVDVEADPRCADFEYAESLFDSISLLER